MISEARKLHLIERVLQIDSEGKIAAIENLLSTFPNEDVVNDKPFLKFAGIWSEKEANEISKIINESCEKVNPEDWK